MSSTAGIEFVDVTKRFPDGTVAVGNFSLLLPAHKTTVFVGSSGCGKTTLLQLINRLIEPSAGDILIDGKSTRNRSPVELRREIGYVMQHGGLLPHFTVLDNIATVPRLKGIPRKAARERSREILDIVGLDQNVAGRYPRQLSGGQQQRVGVARALASDSNILLMDEPFGAVDPIVRAELQRETMRLQRDLDKTVVFVTHDIDEALLLADQVVILEKEAAVAQIGSPSEIIENPASDFVAQIIGVEKGKRALHPKQTANGIVLVDEQGRTQGRLATEVAE